MKHTRDAVLAMTILLLGGCGSAYRVDPLIDADHDAPRPFETSSASPLRGPILKINPYTYDPEGAGTSLFAVAAGKTGAPEIERVIARNRLLEAMIGVSDQSVSAHLAALKSAQANVNLALGGAALAMTGGASVAGEELARALASAATGLQGAQSMVNQDVFAQSFAESVIALVQAERVRLAAQLRSHYRDGLDVFPLERAIAEGVAYHESGSVYRGLALARRAIERDADQRENAAR